MNRPRRIVSRHTDIDVKLVVVDGVQHYVELIAFQGTNARGRIWSGRLGRSGWISDYDHGRVVDVPIDALPRQTLKLRIA
jgi:hypothetical protein